MSATLLREISTEELVAELDRRCTALVLAGFRLNGTREVWHLDFKGSNALLAACLRSADYEVGQVIQQRRAKRMSDYDPAPPVGGAGEVP